jgi:hypothetical protein
MFIDYQACSMTRLSRAASTTAAVTWMIAAAVFVVQRPYAFANSLDHSQRNFGQSTKAVAARKGATENALIRLFKWAYMFRPDFLKATAGDGSERESFLVR